MFVVCFYCRFFKLSKTVAKCGKGRFTDIPLLLACPHVFVRACREFFAKPSESRAGMTDKVCSPKWKENTFAGRKQKSWSYVEALNKAMRKMRILKEQLVNGSRRNKKHSGRK